MDNVLKIRKDPKNRAINANARRNVLKKLRAWWTAFWPSSVMAWRPSHVLVGGVNSRRRDQKTRSPNRDATLCSGAIDDVIVRRSTTSSLDRSKIAQHSWSPRRET